MANMIILWVNAQKCLNMCLIFDQLVYRQGCETLTKLVTPLKVFLCLLSCFFMSVPRQDKRSRLPYVAGGQCKNFVRPI